MKYRVTFRLWSDVQKNFILVDDTIEAHGFDIGAEGTLVFYDEDSRNLLAIPPTFWFHVQPEPEVASTIVT